MSEINNNEVDENKETEETQENKELTTKEKYDSLSDEDRAELNKQYADYQRQNPEATKEDKLAFADEAVSKKYDEVNNSSEDDVDKGQLEKDHPRGLDDDDGR